MNLIETPLFAYILAWFGFMGGIWALFDRAETVATGDARDAVSRWLHNLDLTRSLPNWPAAFAALFDYVFGKRHFSRGCFYRSCIASLVSVVLVTLVWVALRPEEFSAFIQSWTLATLSFGVLVVMFINFIPDYFSLLESRYVIQWVAAKATTIRIVVSLVIDFAATLVIFFVAVAIFIAVMELIRPAVRPHIAWDMNQWSAVAGTIRDFFSISLRQWKDFVSLHSVMEGMPAAGIALYSTFFTSVWVWLYALSGSGVKLLNYLGVGIGWLRKILDINDKPIRSLGFVSMLLVTVVFMIVPIMR